MSKNTSPKENTPKDEIKIRIIDNPTSSEFLIANNVGDVIEVTKPFGEKLIASGKAEIVK